MYPSKVWQKLAQITWRYKTHHAKDGRRPEAEECVRKHYNKKNLESRGVEKAEIKSAFHGGDGSDKEHLTVEFQKGDGEHVTTHHVHGPRSIAEEDKPKASSSKKSKTIDETKDSKESKKTKK